MCVAACVAYARGLTNHIARPNRTKNMSTADNQLNKVTPVSYELMNAVHFFHSFSHSYFLKPSTIETKIFVLLLNQEGHDHLRKECYTRLKFVSQIRHAFHSLADPRNSNIPSQLHG